MRRNKPIKCVRRYAHTLFVCLSVESFVIVRTFSINVICSSSLQTSIGNFSLFPFFFHWIQKILRVLRSGGTFVCMSYGQPEDREQYLMSVQSETDLETAPTDASAQSKQNKSGGEQLKQPLQSQSQIGKVIQQWEMVIKFCKKPNLKDVKVCQLLIFVSCVYI